jgi:hypothetical protein
MVSAGTQHAKQVQQAKSPLRSMQHNDVEGLVATLIIKRLDCPLLSWPTAAVEQHIAKKVPAA